MRVLNFHIFQFFINRCRRILRVLSYIHVLSVFHRTSLQESLWVVGNLLGGTDAHCAAVLRSGAPVAESILEALTCDHFDVQRKAVMALLQACRYLNMSVCV